MLEPSIFLLSVAPVLWASHKHECFQWFFAVDAFFQSVALLSVVFPWRALLKWYERFVFVSVDK